MHDNERFWSTFKNEMTPQNISFKKLAFVIKSK